MNTDRMSIAAIKVKVDCEYGIMDIGRKVKFNHAAQVFERAGDFEHGYTVITYQKGCTATVDFTEINAIITLPENWLKTTEDVYKFFNGLEEARQRAIQQEVERFETVTENTLNELEEEV